MSRISKTLLLTFSVLVLAAGPLAVAADHPNILWLTSEDNNVTWVGCYGNPQATTPNIDRLAKEGFLYENCYSNAPVCAPSRSTWITGIYAISSGTQPMRSRYDIPHDVIKYYPDYLRKAGYHVTNHTKTDFNIGGRPDKDCWDGSAKFGWKDCKPGQPFFCIVNFTVSHESQAFGSVEKTRHDPAKVTLHKYHPDVPDMRKNYAKYMDAVENMDKQLGEVLAELEKDGLLEDTIIVYCSDHGGVLPRSKRFLYDSGIHCPLVIRIPEKYKSLWPAEKPGSHVDRLVSFIDMPKTWLSLANATVPKMQGNIFLGPGAEPEREYHYSFRTRMDERIDNIRAVHGKRFLYIKNYMPQVPLGQHLDYLWNMRATQVWEEQFLAGKTTPVTSRFFLPKASVEELYDSQADPDNIHNLIDDPQYAKVAQEMRTALREWQLSIHDAGLLPEEDLVKRAKDNNLTIYELVRNPKLYDLPGYLDAADLALARDPAKLPQLVKLMSHADSGMRYWGTMGCLLLGEKAKDAHDALVTATSDDSHEVRAIAAWALFKVGDADNCFGCLGSLLDDKSTATLTVLNIIDWMGDDAKPLLPKVQANAHDNSYEGRMFSYLLKSHNLEPLKKKPAAKKQ